MANKNVMAKATLSIDHNVSGTFMTVGQIRNLQPPMFTREAVEATTTDSTLDEFIAASIPNWGMLRFTQCWEPGDTSHQELDTAAAAATVMNCKIVYDLATDKTDTFSGFITEMGPEAAGPKDLITRTVVIQLTTVVTRT